MSLERRPLPYTWERVKEELQLRLLSLLKDLGIKEKPDHQGMVRPLNPNRGDKKPGSLIIWTEGEFKSRGRFKDFSSDDGGDIFGLIQFWARPRPAGKMDVYWWALEWLGWDKGNVRTLSEDVEARERREREQRAFEAKEKQRKDQIEGALFKLWLGLPPILGTPGEYYLREVRKIPMDRLAHQPGATRWAEHVEWIDPETGEVHEWRNVIVNAMTAGKRVAALHRTWLLPDGSGPDPVRKARGRHKTMIGTAAGAAIRVSPGPSGLSPTMAERKGRTDPLIITEGYEDALTLAVARPDCRAWAAGSLSLMGLLEWPACASAVVLAADNDWDKPQAMAAFEKVEAWWRGQARGRPVHVVRAAAGKDFNDMARGEAA